MVANDLIELLRGAVGAVFPSAVAVVRQDGDVVFAEAVGSVGADVPATIDTVYDLASLTKPMATCSIAWKAIADGVMSLDEQVGAVLYPQSTIWREITVRQLMGHASGLPAWRDVHGDWSSPAFFEFEHSHANLHHE